MDESDEEDPLERERDVRRPLEDFGTIFLEETAEEEASYARQKSKNWPTTEKIFLTGLLPTDG